MERKLALIKGENRHTHIDIECLQLYCISVSPCLPIFCSFFVVSSFLHGLQKYQ